MCDMLQLVGLFVPVNQSGNSLGGRRRRIHRCVISNLDNDNNGKVSEMKIDVPNNDFDFKELEFKRTP